MRQVTGSMANVVKGMDSAMKAMDLEKVRLLRPLGLSPISAAILPPKIAHTATFQISAVMDKFEGQFEDLDVATGYYENATSSATATGTPQEAVDTLMNQVADEAGVEMNQEMAASSTPATKVGPTEQKEDELGERLRQLRA